MREGDALSLPKGWKEKNIEEISTVVNGYSFKSKDFSADNDVKSIKITNVGIMNFVEDSSNNLPAAFLQEYSKVKVHEGDLVLALTRTIISGGLKVARVPESYHNSLLNQRVAAIIPKPDMVDSDYLYYYFSSELVYNYVLENVNTLMQPNLSIGDLKKMTLPIPPLQEQKQIVALLDKAFAAIDQAKANIEKNIANAKEFQISATNNLFNSIGDSELLTIDDITDFITDYVANGSFASLKENVNYKKEKDYAVLLRLTDHSKKFKNNFVYVDKHSFDFLKKSTVYPNDIILSNVGARLGTAFRAPDLGMPMTLGPNAILIKAEKLGDYLFCWLQSAYGQKAIKSVVSGAGQPKFNKTQFKKIIVPIPKKNSDRNEVVNKINLTENEFKNLYNNYQKKLDSLEELKKSILQKAFAGELTKQLIMDN